MESFFARLEARARERGTLLCVGLDPHPEDLPEPSAQAAQAFCLRLIEATAPYALAFKPNAAFFEIYGAAGWEALRQVIAAAQATGAPVILDAKRGDIASTARAYARAVFHGLGADALTVNPYLGHDAVAPFLEDPSRGVFLLCKTSNPGSADLQDVSIAEEGGQPLFLRVARFAQQWNRHGNLGLVVGATHPEALRQVREAAPDLWFLAPGVGAQGGNLASALASGLRADGLGMLIAVSRGISRAADPATAAQQLAKASARALRQGEPLHSPLLRFPPLLPLTRGGEGGGRGERWGSSPHGRAPDKTELSRFPSLQKAHSERPASTLPSKPHPWPSEKAKAQARALRKRMTQAERLLWRHLRARQLGVHFRRQHPIGPYVLDFYCAQARLAIEIDGGQHNDPQQRVDDAQRTRFLEARGIQVLRFWNHEVLRETNRVLEAILDALQKRLENFPLTPPPSNPPSPFLQGERGGGRQGGEEREASPLPLPNLQREIARALVTTGCVRFGTFTLKSGLQSPIYLDLRLLASFPDLLAQVAAAYADLLRPLTYDRLAALPYAALPIGTAVALHTGEPLIYPRKEVKAYGTRAAIEGLYHPGERVVLLDDLATTGGSKIEAAEKLRAAGLQVSEVVVLIDRQSGARAELAAQGLRLHAVFTLTELLGLWEAEGLVPTEQLAAVRRWLAASRKDTGG